jgi:hypothetical protein
MDVNTNPSQARQTRQITAEEALGHTRADDSLQDHGDRIENRTLVFGDHCGVGFCRVDFRRSVLLTVTKKDGAE